MPARSHSRLRRRDKKRAADRRRRNQRQKPIPRESA
jgi:hypothetical protein